MSDNHDIDIDQQSDTPELYEHHRFTVDPGQTTMRIDVFLADRIGGSVSRSRIQQAAEAKCILVNNKPVKASYKIKPLDSISVVMATPPHELEVGPEDIPLDIVYEDDDLIVVNKPAGMVVHPAYGNYTGTLVNALMHHLRHLPLFSSGQVRPGLVHRIDKNTSGLLVIGKNEMATNALAKQFFERTTSRRYVALAWGDMESDEGTIEGNIDRHPNDRTRRQVCPPDQGKHAVTHWRTLERFGFVSLVECRLETGRTHQIRVHFAHIRHPLFNDEVYGGDRIVKGNPTSKFKQFIDNCFGLCPRQALHARTLGFTHPTTDQAMHFEAPLPPDMASVIEKWRTYSRYVPMLEED